MRVLIFSSIAILMLSTMMILPVNSQSYNTHEITVSEKVSFDFPVVGTLQIFMEYSIDFEIRKPSSIEAGDSSTVSIIPRTGTLTTAAILGNNEFGPVSIDINLGDKKSIPLAGIAGFNIHFVALPTAEIQSSVTGPATISPQTASIDYVGTKDFQVHVSENIGTSNEIQIKFPVTMYVAATGGIGAIIQDFDLDPFLIPFATKTLTETISIYKNYNTDLSIQVSDGTKTGYIKVYPKLTYDNGNELSNSVSIYVDGVHKTTVSSNQWSADMNVGTGSHNIQAKFLESKSSNNNAIIFLESQSSVRQIDVKSSSSSVTPQKIQPASTEDGGGCLIATATFGSELAPQVQQLRELRDIKLLQTESGSSFMESFNNFYYSFSPYIADYEREIPVFKEMVKVTITPMISSLSILNYVDMDSEAEVLGYGISLILFNIGMYIGIPVAIIVGIRRI